MTTTDHTRRETTVARRGGWRARLAATALGGTLIAGTMALGAPPAGAAPVPPSVVALTPGVPDTYSTPADMRVRGIVTIQTPTSGIVTVSLFKPKADGSSNTCTGSAYKTATRAVSVVDNDADPNDGMVASVQFQQDLVYGIKRTDPEGVWQWQASYKPAGVVDAIKSACGDTLVLHRADTDPPDPDDPDPVSPSTLEARVTRQFRDLLDRNPSQIELTSWVTRLQAGTATIPDLIAELRNSPEHVNIIDPVTRLYFAYFLRTPDADGLQYWFEQRESGRSLIWISDFFSQSPEFQRRYGSLNNSGFVDLIYRNILDRGGDVNGKAFWNAQLDQGLRSRGDVMVGFSESPEYKAAMANEVHIAVLHVLMLGRSPGNTQFTGLLAMLDLGEDAADPFTVADLAEELMGYPGY